VMPRGVTEEAAASVAARSVRVSVVRLPQGHDRNKRGSVALAITLTRQKGVSAYVGDGANRWPASHRLDTARLYRLVLEKGPPGSRYHAVAEEAVRARAIAELIGRRLNIPVVARQPRTLASSAFSRSRLSGFKRADAGAAGMAPGGDEDAFRS
jgi:nucleoside-diphosphate-sugar epimerase